MVDSTFTYIYNRKCVVSTSNKAETTEYSKMKLSTKILNSMKAAVEYDISFDAKMEYLQELSDSYVKAVEIEEMQAAQEYYGLNTSEETKAEKKVTKLQAYINEVQDNLNKGMHITMAIQAVRSKHMRLMYVKTENSYISKIKKHFKLAGVGV